MTRKEKIAIVEDLAKSFSSFDCFYIIDASGLSVDKVHDFRRRCFEQKVQYKVVKNTLISKALTGLTAEIDSFNKEVLKGFSGILFVQEQSSLPAKIIQAFRKQQQLDIPIFKGASIQGDLFIGEAQLGPLSQLKSREELIGDVATLLQSPMSRLLSSLQSSQHKLMSIMETCINRT